MVEIGDHPILWHIMKFYSHFGFNEFIICLGYKGYCIKEYFAHYLLHSSDVTFDFTNKGEPKIHRQGAEPWKVTLVDTGLNTMTGGRIKRIQQYVKNETFMMTYGDGVSDVDLAALLAFHRRHGRIGTVTSTQPTGRFGAMTLDEQCLVHRFQEKPKGDGAWVNAGFFIMEPGIFDLIEGDDTVFEKEPLESLAAMNNLVAYKHHGFWQPMDTLRDKQILEDLWGSGKAPWKLWV
jgi:glucose-1-phosphate cytidylyltransferase